MNLASNLVLKVIRKILFFNHPKSIVWLVFTNVIRITPLTARFQVLLLAAKLLESVYATTVGFVRFPRTYDPSFSNSFLILLGFIQDQKLDVKTVIDKECLNKLFNKNKGVFIACYHGNFMPLIMPYLEDNGYKVHSWSNHKKEIHFGRTVVHSLQPSNTALLKAKNYLVNNENLIAMMDIHQSHKRAIAINTKFGQIHITDSFFKLAANCNAEVAFLKYGVTGNQVTFEIGQPLGTSNTSDLLIQEFEKFLQT